MHRDISIGNLVIIHREDDGQTEGHLIDLDHAKYTSTNARVSIKRYHTDGLHQEAAMIASAYPGVDTDVVLRAIEAVGLELVRGYIKDALTFSTITNPSTIEDLQWTADVRFHYYQYIPQSQFLIVSFKWSEKRLTFRDHIAQGSQKTVEFHPVVALKWRADWRQCGIGHENLY